MAAYVVAVPAVQLTVGSRMFFLERGKSVPADASEADIERLVAGGFIEIVATDEPEEVEDDETVVLKPLEKMTKAELDELAQADGIDLSGITKNADKVAAITAAREASPADPADPDETAPAGSDL